MEIAVDETRRGHQAGKALIGGTGLHAPVEYIPEHPGYRHHVAGLRRQAQRGDAGVAYRRQVTGIAAPSV
jgi:hypothetical protein